ncbi:1-phosphofructokinase [Calderihabitans maritimus]|uniref:Tagatose-6-phosphate kinase n=1 Tax=Calderihabitans maritimus TaxID=1246530 RepID=A0A1Z5HRH3_9FIRM|nr:1-phosphofructokinase [Calderihabitans maritimus]GAW92126.1 1-phosphofructokinase [Calderihabitans maritimus]
MLPKVVTVTLNPALDKTIIIPRLDVGGLNRVEQMRLDPGGKGVNVAKVLKKFAIDVIATGFIGNSQGGVIQKSLKDLGIKTEFVEVQGVTRTNLKIVDNQTKLTTEINEPGFEVSAEDLTKFREKLSNLLQDASFLILGGSLPRGVPEDIYKDYITLAKGKNVKSILDADGKALKEGIKARPFAVKPNIHELEQLVGRSLPTEQDIVTAGQELIHEGVTVVVVSMGSKGSIVLDKKEAYRVTPFPITPQSTVGAGDSMVAAMTYAFLENKLLEEVARWATAAGTVTASKAGTEVCSFAEVQRLLNDVNVTRIQL